MTEERTPDLSPEEKAEVARTGMHDAETGDVKPPKQRKTLPVESFMVEERLTRAELGEALREYRSATSWTPFAGRDRLHGDFLAWFRWERL